MGGGWFLARLPGQTGVWLALTGAVMVLIVLFLAIFGPALAPYPAHVAGGVDTAARFLAPSAAHPFGTNELGQDVLSLVLAGTQTSVAAGCGVVLIGDAEEGQRVRPRVQPIPSGSQD